MLLSLASSCHGVESRLVTIWVRMCGMGLRKYSTSNTRP